MMRYLYLLFFVMSGIAQSASDMSSIKRGAGFFVEHCASCHSLQYMGSGRLTHDLGPESAHLDLTQVAMPKRDAHHWFGMMPPDLSLTARVRGRTWLANYLKGFYADSSRPFGANNHLLPQTAMPNVLAPMIERAQQGLSTEQELDDAIQDVASFLAYVAEPSSIYRYRIGFFVLVFLCVLLFVLYQLQTSYWRDLD